MQREQRQSSASQKGLSPYLQAQLIVQSFQTSLLSAGVVAEVAVQEAGRKEMWSVVDFAEVVRREKYRLYLSQSVVAAEVAAEVVQRDSSSVVVDLTVVEVGRKGSGSFE